MTRDDVADHEKWSSQLGCERILHSNEVWLYVLTTLQLFC